MLGIDLHEAFRRPGRGGGAGAGAGDGAQAQVSNSNNLVRLLVLC